MRPITSLRAEKAATVEVIFTDIDGTLTGEDGRIPAQVFSTLERLRDAGLTIVPVTGRPAGWCDLIARTWPVDGVIGENGGLYFRRRVTTEGEDMVRVFTQSPDVRAHNRTRLDAIATTILATHPGTGLASDQRYRELDIAIDFCEDVPPLSEEAVEKIIEDLQRQGCQVKLSNIHVNAWFGNHDKAAMCLRYAQECWSWDLKGDDRDRCMFFGDSPNDAPLFALFPLSVGVANVAEMRDKISTLPSFVTREPGAAGFVEGASRLLELRSAGQ